MVMTVIGWKPVVLLLTQLLLVEKSLASDMYDEYGSTGIGPSSCSANLGCSHLAGDCCPTSYTGTFLSCCPTEDTLASCSAHAGCAGLTGDCCPSLSGQDLYCCYQNRERHYRREFTFYGHPATSQNRATYLSSTGVHREQQLASGERRYTYERSANFQFDLIYFQTNTVITNANDYVTGVKKFYLTIDSASYANPCAEILLQLDSLPTAQSDNYPTGRHSRYLGLYTPESKRVEFTFLDRPDASVPDTAVNAIALFFEPGTYVGGSYQYSFLDSMVFCTAQGDALPAPVATAPYPAPVSVAPPTAVNPPPPPSPVYVAPPPPQPSPTKYPTKRPVAVYPPPPIPVYVAPTLHPVATPGYSPPVPVPVYAPPVPYNPPPAVLAPTSVPVDDPVNRPVPVPAPIPDDPVNRPVPVPAPIPDDPVNRPAPVPAPTVGGVMNVPFAAMGGRDRFLTDHELDADYNKINYQPFETKITTVAATVKGIDSEFQHDTIDTVPETSQRHLSSSYDEYDQCLPPPVNRCPARHVGAVCTGLDDETCQNPECANTQGCAGGMVSSYLALEYRSSETVEGSSAIAIARSTRFVLLLLIVVVSGSGALS